MSDSSSDQVLELAVRSSYGKLLSFVAARAGGDLAAAEDALSDAFVAALRQWPIEGIPHKPEAWLLVTARRRLMDFQRRSARSQIHAASLQESPSPGEHPAQSGEDFPDERLKLMFVCAHPAIDPAVRTPLMLQTVLGIEAERIARAFLSSPTAMSQRLVRAKAKIRDAGIPFAVPEPAEWSERFRDVLDAIYAAFTTGWEDSPGIGVGSADLSTEAVWLARVIVDLLPAEPEALGLLALVLYCHARRAARICAGRFVPLPEQDTSLWDRSLIAEAESVLGRAAEKRQWGRFQLEAAIQSVHAQRAISGSTDWAAIVSLYEGLTQCTAALGARIGLAVALSQTHGAARGLDALDSLPTESLANHQPYWAARAHLLRNLGRTDEARKAYQRASGLTSSPAIREFLLGQLTG